MRHVDVKQVGRTHEAVFDDLDQGKMKKKFFIRFCLSTIKRKPNHIIFVTMIMIAGRGAIPFQTKKTPHKKINAKFCNYARHLVPLVLVALQPAGIAAPTPFAKPDTHGRWVSLIGMCCWRVVGGHAADLCHCDLRRWAGHRTVRVRRRHPRWRARGRWELFQRLRGCQDVPSFVGVCRGGLNGRSGVLEHGPSRAQPLPVNRTASSHHKCHFSTICLNRGKVSCCRCQRGGGRGFGLTDKRRE